MLNINGKYKYEVSDFLSYDELDDKQAEMLKYFINLDSKTNKNYIELNPVLSESSIKAFEEKGNFELPSDYRWFISTIANGGHIIKKLIPADFEKKIFNCNYENLNKPFIEEHQNIFADCYESDGDSRPGYIEANKYPYPEWLKFDEDTLYDLEKSEIYAGWMIIAHCGCTFFYVLITAGEHKGKVGFYCGDDNLVNISDYKNFLDFYKKNIFNKASILI